MTVSYQFDPCKCWTTKSQCRVKSNVYTKETGLNQQPFFLLTALLVLFHCIIQYLKLLFSNDSNKIFKPRLMYSNVTRADVLDKAGAVINVISSVSKGGDIPSLGPLSQNDNPSAPPHSEYPEYATASCQLLTLIDYTLKFCVSCWLFSLIALWALSFLDNCNHSLGHDCANICFMNHSVIWHSLYPQVCNDISLVQRLGAHCCVCCII